MQILIDFQDPFEMDYNVARCVTKDGLYTVSLSYMTSLFTVVTLCSRFVESSCEHLEFLQRDRNAQ